jgi:hypothetical protein
MPGAFCWFLSVCGQPGIAIPTMQWKELSCVAVEPEVCAKAVKPKRLVIASARVLILIFSPRA